MSYDYGGPDNEASEMIVDQSVIGSNNLACAINEGFAFVAQTYTAGITGTLAGINIDVISRRDSSPDFASERVFRLHVALCEVVNGFPSPTVLGEITLPTGSAPLSLLIAFPKPVPQVAGVQYAIVVNYADAPPSGAGQGLGHWSGTTRNPYKDGELFFGPDGNIWFASSINDHDVHFRTYVIRGS